LADERFFQRAQSFSVGALAQIGQASLPEGADPLRQIDDVAPLDVAGPAHLSFLDNKKYVNAFRASAAGACVVHPDLADQAPAGMTLLLSNRPYRSYALIAQAFYPAAPARSGIANGALVDATALVDESCEVGPGAVIGAHAQLADGVIVGANAVIGAGVVIGSNTRIGACASLSHCLIGARVEIHPGVRIGQRGFGFAMEADGHVEVPQLGRVIVEDDVEIGANSTVDRGAGLIR
jgi:UDP-3-O-[3-hydroxymyristoyl] glucosamine N-acyltransferase